MFKRNDEEIRILFLNLKTREDVADLLEIKDKSLRYFLYVLKPDNLYREFTIKKSDGSKRSLCAPFDELKNIQKKLSYILNLIYEPKICVYGFIAEKNIKENANNHLKRELLLNIDLKDFFNQIHFGRVRGAFLSPPYSLSAEAATVLAQIACYKGVLPQGAPTSPIITNIVCRPLDNHLMRLSKKHKITYSRYADDITLSTYRKEFPTAIINTAENKIILGKELEHILSQNSFVVNNNKIFLNPRSRRQEVTGLTVNKFPNVTRSYVKNIRALLYNCKKYGVYTVAVDYIKRGLCKNSRITNLVGKENCEEEITNWFRSVLKGKIEFVKYVKGYDSYTFLNFAKIMNQLFSADVFDISIFDSLNNCIKESVLILEYDFNGEYSQGSGFILAGYGLLTSYHVTQNGKLFKVYKHSDYNTTFIDKISKYKNEVNSDKTIDYALYKLQEYAPSCFEIGDSTKLKQGDMVTIIGYPNYQKGDSPFIQTSEITSITTYHGSPFYTFGGRIAHGASGGVVLNTNRQVVGLIKGGIVTLQEEETSDKQGFVPINIILDHISQK